MAQRNSFAQVALAISEAKALVISTGAGMGVDSGLPDFRGDRGFWNAYPLYERLGASFVSMACPEHFERDPAFGWGFYGHRAKLYRQTVPHAGFAILQSWIERFRLDSFVVTSNVDGQFQKAGFSPDRIVEVHGSIRHLQCAGPCSPSIWDNSEDVVVDPETMCAAAIPKCPGCGGVARPNILMFDDNAWIGDRTDRQEDAFIRFLAGREPGGLVVIELGAGTALATIRHRSKALSQRHGALVIRINPREAEIAQPHISLACGALDGLTQIDAAFAT